MKRYFFAILLMSVMLTGNMYAQKQKYAISFLQDANLQTIDGVQGKITLKRKPFSIRFFDKSRDAANKKYYATKIAVLDNKEDMQLAKIGASVNDIPYFIPGTGLAGNREGGYLGRIFVRNDAHHYIFYTDEEDKRANLISEKGDLLELEWHVATIFRAEDRTTIPIYKTDIKKLYFIIFSDRNLNEIVDENELTTVEVIFK